jgi:hypothetical protein
MPYKDPERKKEWERLHRAERLARRRQLRQIEAVEPEPQPNAAKVEVGNSALLIPIIFGRSFWCWFCFSICEIDGIRKQHLRTQHGSRSGEMVRPNAVFDASLTSFWYREKVRPRLEMNRYDQLKLQVLTLFAATQGEWIGPNEAAEQLDFFPARSAWTYFKRHGGSVWWKGVPEDEELWNIASLNCAERGSAGYSRSS